MKRKYFVEVKVMIGNEVTIQQFSFVTYKKAKKIYRGILDTEFGIEKVTIRQKDSLGCSKILDYVELYNVK